MSYLNGLSIGCGAIRPIDPFYTELKRVYVDTDVRGNEIASKILTLLEEKAKDEGFEFIRLNSERNNPKL